MRSVPVIDHRSALAALAAICGAVESERKAAAIAIVDAHGELLAFARLDGTLLSSGVLAVNKAYTSARLNRPTRVLGETLRERGTDATLALAVGCRRFATAWSSAALA